MLSYPRMAIPLAILLIPYAAIIGIGGLFLIFNLYDMGKFGLESGKTTLLMMLYVVGFLFVIGVAATDILTTDWSAGLPLPNIMTANGLFTTGL